MRTLRLSLIAIVCLSTAGLAQESRPRLRYDRAREVAVRGTVVEVRDMARFGAPHGTYLVLKTEANTLNVHLGMRVWSTKGRASFSPGEPVEVVGAFVRSGESQILLAREVRKAGATLTFRNAQGFPSVGRRREP